jgi:hypothetical protein
MIMKEKEKEGKEEKINKQILFASNERTKHGALKVATQVLKN